MSAVNEEWLDRHIAHADTAEYNGEALESVDYVWFVVAGAGVPLVVSLLGWLLS